MPPALLNAKTARLCGTCALTIVVAALWASPGGAENWPSFRGPTGQGLSSETNLPRTWNLSQNVAWRVQVPGLGWSSPVIWDDRVFVTTATPDGTSCRVVCLDAMRGNVVWDKEVFTQASPRKLAENSHATPTPATDGKLVFAAFNGGRIVALDFAGNVAWSWRDSQFISKHGLGASPLLYRDLLIMPFDGNGAADVNNIGYRTAWDGAFIAALDKHTGQEKWRAKRGLSRQAHVTPLIADVQGSPQLISAAGDVVQGFDPDSGERLWSTQSPGEGVVPSIVCGQGLVFSSSGYGTPALRAIRPAARGDAAAAHLAWDSRASVPLMPSFLYADGLLFCLKETGVASCLEAGTGQVLWQERLEGAFGASPVLGEGRIYCLAEDGSTTVLAAGRQFKKLARNLLEGPCKASPAIANGRFFIRSQSSLFCIRSGTDPSPASGRTGQ